MDLVDFNTSQVFYPYFKLVLGNIKEFPAGLEPLAVKIRKLTCDVEKSIRSYILSLIYLFILRTKIKYTLDFYLINLCSLKKLNAKRC